MGVHLVVRPYLTNFIAENATFDISLRRTRHKNDMYIHERAHWTNFRWDASEVSSLQEIVCSVAMVISRNEDTAIRDIQDLVKKNILIEDIHGAKRPSYSIVVDAAHYQKGDLPLSNLLNKYCSYLVVNNEHNV